MKCTIFEWSTSALAAVTVGLMAAAGCATSPAQPGACNAVLPAATSALVWPAAPDEARVAYVGALSDNATCARPQGEAAQALSYPKSMAAGPGGLVYVSDRLGVHVVDSTTGSIRAFANVAGHEVTASRGLAVGGDGDVYVVDGARKRVEVFSKDGAFVRDIGKDGEMSNPQGVAIDGARGRLLVADAALGAVVCYALDGAPLRTIRGTDALPLGVPTQVAVNSLGEVFVVHQGVPRIVIFDADGNYLRGFGPDGDQSGQFARPKGIAIDSEDHVYVTDAAFDNVQIFDRLGQLLLFFGQGGNGNGEFNLPFMMAIDGNDRIFVADYGNHRVQVLQYLGAKFNR